MAQNMGTPSEEETSNVKKLTTPLIIEEIQIRTKVVNIEQAKFVDVEQKRLVDVEEKQIRYMTEEQGQIRYITEEKGQIHYTTKEESTIKYVPKEEETIKYVPKEESTIKFRTIIEDQTILQIKDLEKIHEFLDIVPQLKNALLELKTKIEGLRDYKLVEEIKKVPKVVYIPTEVERIVWKDVFHERCDKCGKEITG